MILQLQQRTVCAIQSIKYLHYFAVMFCIIINSIQPRSRTGQDWLQGILFNTAPQSVGRVLLITTAEPSSNPRDDGAVFVVDEAKVVRVFLDFSHFSLFIPLRLLTIPLSLSLFRKTGHPLRSFDIVSAVHRDSPLQFRHPVSEIELSAAFCYELQASGKSRPQRIPTSFDVPTSDGSLPKANQTIGLPLLRRTHKPISINECNRLSFVRCSFANLLSKNLKVRIYKTVILPVVLYGCETWTLILREEQRLRVFENEVLRTIFGAKRNEVTEEWRKLHNAELHALYSSPDIIRNIKSRRLRWAGYVARMGESRNAYRVLVGRPEGKRPLGRPRRRWEDNIKMDLMEVGYNGSDWINLAEDRDQWRAYVRAAMNLRVP
ncbi:hypothetical protein ANN_13476 [Periplaneta americana]|uniref:Uncharacterized protein n=1 Tax=Periplaneta americana TaxID=6978 RepID=A0ABQ8TLL3_PERAM|nr:hypothetical protein ANN_13476 [Periplaneta americana]